ncbi:hypothetical protein SBV1_370107 [Verrucomicrobia bacterium]|nr:hypothetical protein SBV1_370107 [Verrucomicrobiota bacterium]
MKPNPALSTTRNPKPEGRNPKAEIAKLSGIGFALNTEVSVASVSRGDRTEHGTGCGFRPSAFGFPLDNPPPGFWKRWLRLEPRLTIPANKPIIAL